MKLDPKVESCRTLKGVWATAPGSPYGHFTIPIQSFKLNVIAASASAFPYDWDHVSVSLPGRCPNWNEMCIIKDLFFSPDETVVQFHPKKSEYVDIHPYCLHLWQHSSGHNLPPNQML